MIGRGTPSIQSSIPRPMPNTPLSNYILESAAARVGSSKDTERIFAAAPSLQRLNACQAFLTMRLRQLSAGSRRGGVTVLICAMDHEVANRGDIVAAESALEGSHPGILENTVENNIVKEIHR
jgi:hypothetical protein